MCALVTGVQTCALPILGGAHPAKGAVPFRPTPSAAPGRPCAPRKHRCTRSGFKLVGIEEAQPLRPAVPQDHAYAPDEVVMRHVADVVPAIEAVVPVVAEEKVVHRRHLERSEERRVGKGWVSKWRSRWAQYH